MKLFCQNTAHGLVPMYDADYDEKRKLKIGVVYRCEVSVPRNYEFHKKYFAMINCAWEYQNETRQSELFSNNVELFRKSVEMSAGYSQRVYSHKDNAFIDIPVSISYDKMDGAEFEQLYNAVRDVLFSVYLTHITLEEFEQNLMNF